MSQDKCERRFQGWGNRDFSGTALDIILSQAAGSLDRPFSRPVIGESLNDKSRDMCAAFHQILISKWTLVYFPFLLLLKWKINWNCYFFYYGLFPILVAAAVFHRHTKNLALGRPWKVEREKMWWSNGQAGVMEGRSQSGGGGAPLLLWATKWYNTASSSEFTSPATLSLEVIH